MMKILLVHNHYQLRGGEDIVVEREKNLLLGGGVEVSGQFTSSQTIVKSPVTILKTVWNLHYNQESQEKLSQKISQEKPDLVHIHNFFPNLSPSLYAACAARKIPVVQTLHNYRIICASALLLRKSKPCEKCLVSSPYFGFWHACYRSSRLASLPLAHMINYHRQRDTWNSQVNRFIALSNFAKSKFVAAGIRQEKISIKPNFCADPGPPDFSQDRNYALFVGRLSPEKGIRTLISAWKKMNFPLLIAGDGPLHAELSKKSPPEVRFLGQRTPQEISEIMRQARFLVFPSECYENFPLVIAESFAHGLPILSSKIGVASELIEETKTGVFFQPGNPDDLREKALLLWAETSGIGNLQINARVEYEAKYTPAKNLEKLLEIYRSALV